MVFCPEKGVIMVSTDEYFFSVQFPDPSERAAPNAEIPEVIHGIPGPDSTVPPLHEVPVHMAERCIGTVTVAENFCMVEVQV